MKQLLSAVTGGNRKIEDAQYANYFKKNNIQLAALFMLSAAILFTACTKQNDAAPADIVHPAPAIESLANAGMEPLAANSFTAQELKLARQATAKYLNIDSAIADGYIDVNVVMPNMGYHYQKPEYVDSVFDITHPEFLVYNKDNEGAFKLVAVEYAVPLDLSLAAPGGFYGRQDVWDHNDEFGLWTLHAWIWKFNPEGVFNATNPLVIVKQ